MRHVVILAIVLGAAPAVAGDLREPTAEPTAAVAAIKVGGLVDGTTRRRVDRADARVRVERTSVVVALALVVSAPDDRGLHTGVLELEVPRGSRATALTLSAAGTTMTGEVMTAGQARSTYAAAVSTLRDPALLEWTRAGRETEVLTLSIAPLSTIPQTATVTLELPRTAAAGTIAVHADAPSSVELAAAAGTADRLSIAGRRIRDRHNDGTAPLTATARRGRDPIVLGYGVVTDATSLTDPEPSTVILGESLSLLTPTPPAVLRARNAATIVCTFGEPTVAPERGARPVRSVVRLHLPRVDHCFQQALQRDWHTEGTLTARWMITPAGTVAAATVDGTIDDAALRACVTDVISAMEFAASDEGLTQVHYPFTFTVGEQTRRAREAAAAPPATLADD
jgi:hypothetical protein